MLRLVTDGDTAVELRNDDEHDAAAEIADFIEARVERFSDPKSRAAALQAIVYWRTLAQVRRLRAADPDVRAECQRILDAEARRLLDEQTSKEGEDEQRDPSRGGPDDSRRCSDQAPVPGR